MRNADTKLGTVEATRDRVKQWQADPCYFCEDVLGYRPWSRQAEFLRAAAEHKRTACRSGQKTGKSRALASLAVWNAVCWPGSRFILTEPSYDQIKLVLWHELHALKTQARVPLGGDWSKDPSTGWKFPQLGSEIIGRATNELERWAGLSCAGRMMFAADEASGLPEFVFEAIEGNMAGGAWLVLSSQPLRTSGQFYRAFHGERSIWHCLKISAQESPNCIPGARHIPGLATPEWIEERRQIWGENHNLYRVRVLGDFPSSDDDSLIPLIHIEEAMQRGRDMRARGKLPPMQHLGVDVGLGTGRDASVIAPYCGPHIGDLEYSRQWDPMHLTGRIVQLTHKGGEMVRIDADGLGGPLVGLLREKKVKVEAFHGGMPCDFSGRSGEERFLNMRAFAWWCLRERLDPNIGDGLSLPDEAELIEDLQSPKWRLLSGGKIQLEQKVEIQKRMGRSPDMGDAVVLASLQLPKPAKADWSHAVSG